METGTQMPIDQLIKVLIREARSKKVIIGAMFTVISLSALVVGANWPKVYSSSTTMFADEQNIIRPLMEGSAVTTKVIDHASFCREVIFSRRILDQIFIVGGWAEKNPDYTPVEKERVIGNIKANTITKNMGKGLLRIEYQDQDPERAFKVTQKFAELFIAESSESKRKQSQEAYEFVDKQVQEYHNKLQAAEKKLKEFRTKNLEARPGGESQVFGTISDLQKSIEQTQLKLKEQEIRKSSLVKQLENEAVNGPDAVSGSIYAAQINELQQKLDTLRLSYYDSYPDIVQTKKQIEELRRAMYEDQERRKQALQNNQRGGGGYVDSVAGMNPLVTELRSEISKAKIEIETFKTRIEEMQRLLQEEKDKVKQIHESEAVLSELTRDYEVNRDIYQDLLRRKEKARVSMHLDIEGQGLTFKLQEPANLPLVPKGVRFLHFFLLGPALGLAVPLGLLFVLLQIDPRIRMESILSQKADLNVLATIPHVRNRHERPQREYVAIGIMLALVGCVYVFVALAKVTGLSWL